MWDAGGGDGCLASLLPESRILHPGEINER